MTSNQTSRSEPGVPGGESTDDEAGAPTDGAAASDAGAVESTRNGPNPVPVAPRGAGIRATGGEQTGRDTTVPAALSSPRSKLVYLYLRTTGGGSARDLCEDLGMQLVAAYPVLDSLVRQDLVVRDGETFRPA